MTKPILVYVGHSYHRLTSSTAFLLDLLRQRYELSIIWDEGWQPSGLPVSAQQINTLQPDVVLFFQTLPTRDELLRVRCKNLFLAPMHDHVVGNPHIRWARIHASGIRLINFCRATHYFFANLGFESRQVQYWPEPQAQSAGSNHAPRVFFWPRRHEIGWRVLKALLGPVRPELVVMRVAPDPGEEIDMPSTDDIRDYHIQVVSGWLEKNRYLELLTSCNIFIAPRLYEGIGQSFLEAMSYGLAVVAANAPTMNEYIRHNENGYLYSPSQPLPLDFSRLQLVREQAMLDVRNGNQEWLLRREEILTYLHSAPQRKQRLMWRLRGYWYRQSLRPNRT